MRGRWICPVCASKLDDLTDQERVDVLKRMQNPEESDTPLRIGHALGAFFRILVVAAIVFALLVLIF